jgi:uncharacterized protein involved in exopolysaccharide biosynthesis
MGMIQTHIGGEWNAADLVRYFQSRRRFLVVACATALLVTGVVSVLLPARYTATASLVIEPPAGMDPRSATALSPVYLESLKTYENLVSSDSLFQQAVERLGIRDRYATRSIESLKRSILRVSKPVNTRIIEIGVTLDNPKDAQRLASYIASQAAALNRSIDQGSASGTSAAAEAALQRAEERLRDRRRASDTFLSAGAGLEAELSNLAELKYAAERDRGELQADLAESTPSGRDPAASRARAAELERQSNELQKRIEATAERLGQFRQRRDDLEAELKAARTDYDEARDKLDDLKSAAAFRGERLEVLDPGIVPQRPSFPNTPLNLFVALLLAVTASFGYLALCFGLGRSQRRHEQARGLW